MNSCNNGFDQWSGGTGATFEGFLQCVDNLNPIASIRNDFTASVNSTCTADAGQAAGRGLFGAALTAAPFAKGIGLPTAGTRAAAPSAPLNSGSEAAATSDAPVVWPPNNGFHGDLGPNGNPGVTILKPGTLVDRFGLDAGRFVVPKGIPIGARSLAPGTIDGPYSIFEVTKRLPVQAGPAEPWFDQPGMGIQYRLPASVSDLLEAGYLRRVN